MERKRLHEGAFFCRMSLQVVVRVELRIRESLRPTFKGTMLNRTGEVVGYCCCCWMRFKCCGGKSRSDRKTQCRGWAEGGKAGGWWGGPAPPMSMFVRSEIDDPKKETEHVFVLSPAT